MNPHQDAIYRSSTNFNTVQYLLDKELPINIRKSSEVNHFEESQRSNFVLTHKAASYNVLRVYIDSLTSSAIRLYYSKFTPTRKEATLCIVHGYGQSSDNFIEMAQYFAKNGFVVNLIDLRGFGYSGGARAFSTFRGHLSDIQNLLRRCCEKGLPTYLLGHGFGSLLILALLQQNPNLPLAGVIIMSPLFKFPHFSNISWLGRFLLFLLSLIWPYLQINNRLDPTALTNNPHKVKQCLDGIFSYQFVSIDMAKKHVQLSQKVMRDAEKFKYPLLLLYGMKDIVQPIEQVKRFYRYVGSKEKASFVFKTGFHHLYADQHADKEVFPKILDWIFELGSNKNQIKWTVPPGFDLSIFKTVPIPVKYMVLVIVPVLVALLVKIKSWLRARACR